MSGNEQVEIEMGVMVREVYLNEVAEFAARKLADVGRTDAAADVAGHFYQSPYRRDDMAALLGVAVMLLAEERSRGR